jgi:acetyl esterase/lipase
MNMLPNKKFNSSALYFSIALLLPLFLIIGISSETSAQLYKQSRWGKIYAKDYDVAPNVVYKRVGHDSIMLDIYSLKNKTIKHPLLIFFHGGGWVRGSKDSTSGFTPYLNNDWVVINAEYRFIQKAKMPASVEDARSVLAWAYENAKKYGIDTNKIVLSGSSSGAHLALIAGMVPPNSVLDNSGSGSHILKPVAIIDFYGPTDLISLMETPNHKKKAALMFAEISSARKIAKLISPITYVRKDLPPIFLVQGDEDPTVPYSQSVNLKTALDKAGARNYLYTVRGGKHGKFSKGQMAEIYERLSQFLKKEAGLDFTTKDKNNIEAD